MKHLVKSVVGATIVVGWVLMNVGILLGLQLGSLEDDFSAWSVLRDPYTVIPYVLITGLCGIALWFMFHKRL